MLRANPGLSSPRRFAGERAPAREGPKHLVKHEVFVNFRLLAGLGPVLAASVALLGASWGLFLPLGPFFGPLGSIVGPLGPFFGPLGAVV